MSTEEKGVVEVTSSPAKTPLGIPMHFKKRPAGPSSSKFVVKPKAFPQLVKSIKEFTWNDAKKELHIRMLETPDFDVFRWIDFTQAKSGETARSPFADAEMNSLVLDFKDNSDLTLAQAEFTGLTLADHHCSLNSLEYTSTFGIDGDGDDGLYHTVTLNYQYCIFAINSNRAKKNHAEPVTEEEGETAMDQEWQTVEIL